MVMKIKKTPILNEKIVNLKDYPYYIKDFVNKLNDKDLNYFYHNIDSLKIVPVNKKDLKIKNATAEYDMYTDNISFDENKFKKSIMHELLHVATRVKTDDRIYLGFAQILYNHQGFGIGICEGYTAMLDDRYFLDYEKSKIHDVGYVYQLSSYFCQLLELIVGQEEMEEMYFRASLYDLAKTLALYSSESETMKFILVMDRLFCEADNKMVPNFKKVCNYFEYGMYFIAQCLLTKNKLLYHQKLINIEEYNNGIKLVKSLLKNKTTYFKVIKSRDLSNRYNELDKKTTKRLEKIL